MEPWGFEPQIPPCHGGVIPFHYGPERPSAPGHIRPPAIRPLSLYRVRMVSTLSTGAFSARVIDCCVVKEQFARFISDFKESSRSSRRTDKLFAIALSVYIPIMLSQTLPPWLFAICAFIGVVGTIAAIVSLALDNRRARNIQTTRR